MCRAGGAADLQGVLVFDALQRLNTCCARKLCHPSSCPCCTAVLRAWGLVSVRRRLWLVAALSSAGALGASALPLLLRRYLYEEDGRFVEHHLQDWQHSAMYLAFLLSGCVDLLSHYAKMPSGIEHVSLGPVCGVSWVQATVTAQWSCAKMPGSIADHLMACSHLEAVLQLPVCAACMPRGAALLGVMV